MASLRTKATTFAKRITTAAFSNSQQHPFFVGQIFYRSMAGTVQFLQIVQVQQRNIVLAELCYVETPIVPPDVVRMEPVKDSMHTAAPAIRSTAMVATYAKKPYWYLPGLTPYQSPLKVVKP